MLLRTRREFRVRRQEATHGVSSHRQRFLKIRSTPPARTGEAATEAREPLARERRVRPWAR